jgi:DNA processing protein
MDERDAVVLSCLSGVSSAWVAGTMRTLSTCDGTGSSSTTLSHLLDSYPRRHENITLDSLYVQADRALVRAGERGIQAIRWGDVRYPTLLGAIPDPPPVLWTAGDAARLNDPAIAVIGSRAGSRYALDVAEQLARDLARRGVTVVSGLARGVDSAAHRGALAAGGNSIAVLGSGADVIYPPEHKDLAADLTNAGAIVSELLPGTPPRRSQFPRRNRIISGLSLSVVVVEASEKSGSLITAGCALEQGRDVMVVPGSVLSGRNRGSHALLRDGAKIVESADDIVDEVGGLGQTRPGVPGPVPTVSNDPVLRVMAPGETYDLDMLAAESGLRAVTLLPRLLELEISGAICRVGGGRFARSCVK